MPSKSAQKKKSRANAAGPAPTSSNETTVNPRSWDSLDPPLSPWIRDALASMGFAQMTPVQASTIPAFIGNKDVVVEAVTGSGKTLAFLIPLLERILRAPEPAKDRYVAGIIISPTRELASQIYTVLESLLAFRPSTAPALEDDEPGDTVEAVENTDMTKSTEATKNTDNIEAVEATGATETIETTEDVPLPEPLPKIKPLLLLGGNTSPQQDLRDFLEKSPNLLIGTPGRLNELLASKHVHCSSDSFEALVLDEADRLLDLGFKETLTKIISRLPKQRRTGLFSASVTDAVVGSLVRTGLRNPVKIVVKVQHQNEEKRTPASLQMSYILAEPTKRLVYLQRILSPEAAALLFPTGTIPFKTIIYVSNCASVDYFASLFPAILPGPQAKLGGYSIVPLHGKQAPNVRRKNFTTFTSSSSPAILLTTDLAARGLDIPEVDLVVQIDPPTDPKVFLHRCGRAGRAGRRGLAVLFLSPGREEGYIDFLGVRKTPVAPLELEGEEPTPEEAASVVHKMRAVVLRDRALCEKGMKAFVSHVRAHSKHQTSSIFRVQDLDWQSLADSFALVRMPRMPELRKDGATIKVDLGVEVNLSTYAYKDKKREQERLEELAKPKEQPAMTKEERAQARKKNAPWSSKMEHQEVKEGRREKKRKRREAKMTEEEKAKENEWKEMVEEVKKRRKRNEEESGEEKHGEEAAAGKEEFFKGFD